MTSQTRECLITIHILSNISRSKVKQKKNIGQLIEYNLRNIFLEKLSTKCGEQASPKPFNKKTKLIISLDQRSDYKLFVLCVQVDVYLQM